MIFISLTKWKQPLAKRELVRTETLSELEKQGIKVHTYVTFGRYDAISIIEAPTEKDAMKALLPLQDVVDTETLVAIPREEVITLF